MKLLESRSAIHVEVARPAAARRSPRANVVPLRPVALRSTVSINATRRRSLRVGDLAEPALFALLLMAVTVGLAVWQPEDAATLPAVQEQNVSQLHRA